MCEVFTKSGYDKTIQKVRLFQKCMTLYTQSAVHHTFKGVTRLVDSIVGVLSAESLSPESSFTKVAR